MSDSSASQAGGAYPTVPNPAQLTEQSRDFAAEIYAALSDLSLEQAVTLFAGKNFSEFKQQLADLAAEVLGCIGREMRRLLAEPGHIDGILRRGSERARAIAEPHLREVFDIMGLLRP